MFSFIFNNFRRLTSCFTISPRHILQVAAGHANDQAMCPQHWATRIAFCTPTVQTSWVQTIPKMQKRRAWRKLCHSFDDENAIHKFLMLHEFTWCWWICMIWIHTVLTMILRAGKFWIKATNISIWTFTSPFFWTQASTAKGGRTLPWNWSTSSTTTSLVIDMKWWYCSSLASGCIFVSIEFYLHHPPFNWRCSPNVAMENRPRYTANVSNPIFSFFHSVSDIEILPSYTKNINQNGSLRPNPPDFFSHTPKPKGLGWWQHRFGCASGHPHSHRCLGRLS